MKRQVGEIFEYNGVKLQVQIQQDNEKLCKGCYFHFGPYCNIPEEEEGCDTILQLKGKVFTIFKEIKECQ